jgi:signal transduction histidine kinase
MTVRLRVSQGDQLPGRHPVTPKRLDAVGRLAQYALLPRIAAPGLTLVALQRDPRMARVVLVIVPLMMVLNYVALTHWHRVVRQLRKGPTYFYPVLDLGLALAVLAVVGAGTPMVLYLLATGLIFGLVYRAKVALGLSGLSTVGYGLIVVSQCGYVPGSLDFHTTVTLPSVLLTVGAAGVAVRRLLVEQQRSAAELSKLRAAAAIRDERLRMARDLHDSLTKNLHGVWLLSRTLEGALDRGELAPARAASRVIGETARSLSGETRSVIQGLRHEAQVSPPLAEALRAAAIQVTRGHSISVDVIDRRIRTGAGSEPALRFELLAVATEALHNTVKHADAHGVQLILEDVGDDLGLVITDDGGGFTDDRIEELPQEGHFGLLGMRERAAGLGGSLTVRSVPGEGTTVRLVVPAKPRRKRASGVRARVKGRSGRLKEIKMVTRRA